MLYNQDNSTSFSSNKADNPSSNPHYNTDDYIIANPSDFETPADELINEPEYIHLQSLLIELGLNL